MDRHLNDKIALVTGASRGIGRAIAVRLAERGARVALVATSAERCADTAAACAAAAGSGAAESVTQSYGVDVADHAAVQKLVEQVVAEMGGLHILVNNAGITRDQLLLRMTEEDFDRVIDVNLKGSWNFLRAAARTLMKARGRIVNIASVVGITGNPGQANYSASKAGILGMTRAVAKELASRGVCVNAVAPGFIETDMTSEVDEKAAQAMLGAIPLGRAGAPADVAAAVDFLVGPGGEYVTGQTIVVDGGLSI